MTNRQAVAPHAGCGAATCRWATPTLFLTAPYWWEAERAPWACLRDGTPRILTTTEECADCPRWEPRKNAAAQAA
jgi:hypothetical protein